jgi:V/A-type H+-transporting ATPase subunit I
MTIERVQRLEMLFPVGRREEVLAALHRAGIVHLDPPGDEVRAAGAEAVSVAAEEIDARIAALSAALEVVDEHVPRKKTLVESFFGAPMAASAEEVVQSATRITPAEVGRVAGKLRERWRQIGKFEAEARTELAALEPFLDLPFTGRDLAAGQRTAKVLGTTSADGFNGLRLDPAAAEHLAFEEVRRRGERVWLLAAFAPGSSDAAWARLRAHGFEETPFPPLAGSAAERAAALRRDLERVGEERDEVRREAGKLASDRREIELALAYWEDRRELKAAAARTAATRRTGVLTGYVRERDVPRLRRLLDAELACCAVALTEPALSEDVPVSIRLPKWLKPMQLLVNMFGLPHYRSFDPTPWLTLSFLIFFGCCFGDVFYGLGLCVLCYFVMRRYRHCWVKDFFQLFFYAGIFAIIVGLLTGTWAGDLLSVDDAGRGKYLDAANPLVRFAGFCGRFDPLKSALYALMISLGLGVVNQFWGIALKMTLEFRRRNYAAAFFDAGLWFLVLPGMMISLVPLFTAIPPALQYVGWGLLGGGCLGLVLTQGRNEEGFVGKAVTGVVSIYGILGSYGITGFIGDVLSYSRLLALGLTTSIVAMSINIICSLLKTAPMVGPVIFVLAMVIFHVCNALLSILGSFVHPARLILMEFFNRFYEGGGRAFLPLAFRSERVAIIKDRAA